MTQGAWSTVRILQSYFEKVFALYDPVSNTWPHVDENVGFWYLVIPEAAYEFTFANSFNSAAPQILPKW